MNADFEDKEFRDAFVDEFIRTGIAFQLRALRQRENWSQKDLGEKTGKPQNVISRLEDPDYGSFTVKTLLELASAFDVALLVRFVSFSDLWKTSQRLAPGDLAVSRFSDEANDRPSEFQSLSTSSAIHETHQTSMENRLPTLETTVDPIGVVVRTSSSTSHTPFSVAYSGNV